MTAARYRGVDKHHTAHLVAEGLSNHWDEQAGVAVWNKDDRIVGNRLEDRVESCRPVRRRAVGDHRQIWNTGAPSLVCQLAGG